MTEISPSGLASVDMIRTLVGFDTVSRDSNLNLIDYVERYLADLGVDSLRVYDDTATKACLYATLGPQDQSGVMLSGHTDVVPVDGQEWSSDPFAVVQKDGRLYGRGTSDMKSFLAIALALAPDFLARQPNRPIHLAFSYDEEVGCLGVRPLIDVVNQMPVKPLMGIIGEPTEMNVVVAHKGKKSLCAHVRGLECHSSLAPHGVNAVEYAAEVIAHMKGMARRIAAEGPFDKDFDVPYTTIHVGTIDGGTALNIVPKDCRFQFEFRYLPGDDPDVLLDEIKAFAHGTLEPAMRAIDPASGFTWEETSAFPGLNTASDSDVVTLVKRLAGRNDHAKVAFGTEAGLYSERADIPVVVCGPGSIDQAHKPDEFISLDQVAAGESFVRRLMDALCGDEVP
jgi:acetylornithine deacetylase